MCGEGRGGGGLTSEGLGGGEGLGVVEVERGWGANGGIGQGSL